MPEAKPRRSRRKLARWQLLIVLVIGAAAASVPLLVSAEETRQEIDLAGTGPPEEPEGEAERVAELAEPVPVEGWTPRAAPREGGKPGAAEAVTTGSVAGVLTLDKELVGKLSTFQVKFEEAVNPRAPGARPRRTIRAFKLEPEQRSAQFVVRELPYSAYGWHVTAYSPGLNGTDQVIALSARHPEAWVQLSLKKPILVSIEVKDQLRLPVMDIPVLIRPVGRLLGRTIHHGKSDPYGHVHFSGVLRGEYELVVGPPQTPVIEVRKIYIPDKGHHYERLEVPRGSKVTFYVQTAGGYGLEGVQVVATAKESKVYRKYECVSDRLGKATFDHLPEGPYYVHFRKKGYAPGFRNAKVSADTNHEETVSLTRAR
ncbi:MAG: collagen binding domain-containing protein [Planctomycetota bacterium]